ncbi:MAG: 50S ribosomal protein L4 [Proteobacteria bacterium]|nr:50S ribosomal protein L4 [Pseudomonadota bacterium]
MAVIDVQNAAGDNVSKTDLTDSIFNIEVKKSILHDVVKMQLACKRSGTATVKNRSDVRGSTRKLYRQKGTGNARPGDIKSPLRRGGGVVFGPHQRSYAYKLPKKVMRLALKMALSSKFQEGNLVVIDKIELEGIKTKKFMEVVNALNLKKILFVTAEKDEKIERSARNIPDVKVIRSEGLNVYDILKYDHLVLLESSIKNIEGRFNA